MHTDATEENDQHGHPYVIFHQGVAKGVHFTTNRRIALNRGPEIAKTKATYVDQDTERIHVILINCLREPTFDKVIYENADPSTPNPVLD